jgi:5-hydroxytryptamine receptor 1
MIIAVWTVAGIVSIAPLFGWKDPEFVIRIEQEKRCLISQDIGYQIFATIATFYGPLIFILALYWKIFQVNITQLNAIECHFRSNYGY